MVTPDPAGGEDDAFLVVSDVPPGALLPGATMQYTATVTARGTVLPLTRETGLAYAATVMEAAARAEYDQAVYRHMYEMLGDHRQALSTVLELREDRLPLDDSATFPFTFEPLVLSKTMTGAVNGYVRGAAVTQWPVADARQHALHVLDAVVAVELDTAYHRYLKTVIGLEAADCRAAVGLLREHRPDDGGPAGGYTDRRPALPAGPSPPTGPAPTVMVRSPLGLIVTDRLPPGTPPPPQPRRGKGKRR